MSVVRRIASFAAAMAVVSGGAVVLAAPANAAARCPSQAFCAFDNVDYGGVLLSSRAGRGSNRVDVADNRVSSAINLTGNRWEGVTVRTRLSDQVVYRFAPNTAVNWVGGNANDKIDHFNVR